MTPLIPQRAIEKAIEGGWKNDLMRANPHADIEALIEDGHFQRDNEKILLDPTFFQCLGKALNWGEGKLEDDVWDWRGYASKFYDLILTNGDITAFWEEIIGKK